MFRLLVKTTTFVSVCGISSIEECLVLFRTMMANISMYYAIYGTDVVSGEIIDELYLMASPFEVEAPTAINEVRWKMDEGSGDIYNLNGQRVDQQYKGLVIRNGRVVLNK